MMKKRFKAILGRVAALVSALPFVITSMPASADSTVILLDSITTRYLFGDSISGGYLDNEGNFKSCTFEFSDYLTLGDSNLVNQGSYGSSTTLLLHYKASVQNDIGQVLTDFQPICYLDLDTRLENVTTFQWLVGAWINGVWTTTNLSTLDTFAYMMSEAPALPISSVGTGDGRYRTTFQGNKYSSGKAGLFQINGASKAFSGCFYSVSSSTASDLFLDTVQFCSCYYSSGFIEIAFACPYVNADFVVPSDTPDIPSIGVGGSGSGTISENSSGGYDIDYNINIDMPDYSYNFNQIQESLNPDYDSSNLDRLSSNVDDYQTVEDSLLDLANDGLSSTPDLEFDDSLIEDAYNPLDSFFDINIVGIMVFWVGCIAFISYILFGKWV